MSAAQDVSVLLLDAAVLMVVGMGVVFGFLMLLVLAVHSMSWFLRHSVQPLTATTPAVVSGVSPAVVAAISAAIEHHQKQNKDIQ